MTEFGTVRRDGDFGAVQFDRVYDAAPAALSSGWHDFLDVLGSGPPPAEDRWRELLPEYRSRVAAL
jgi:hypothetical protein